MFRIYFSEILFDYYVLQMLRQEKYMQFYFLPRCMECRRGLAMRILSVCLFVFQSVKRVDCDNTEVWSVQIFTPYERLFSLVFQEEKWLVGRPFPPESLGQPDPVGAKSPIFNRYSLVAPQP